MLLLAGGAVSLAGPVGFIGLMVPHLVRYLVGWNYRVLIPGAAVFGALLVLVADLGAPIGHRAAEDARARGRGDGPDRRAVLHLSCRSAGGRIAWETLVIRRSPTTSCRRSLAAAGGAAGRRRGEPRRLDRRDLSLLGNPGRGGRRGRKIVEVSWCSRCGCRGWR